MAARLHSVSDTRGIRHALAVCGLIVLLWVCVATPARAAVAGAGPLFVELTNADRATVGLPAYATASDLDNVAQGQADRMAAEHHIFHNANLATDVVGWQRAGENVGVGRGPYQLNQMLMVSPDHRANLLSTDYGEIGVGTTVGDDGRLYVSEVFRGRTRVLAPIDAPAGEDAGASSDPAPATDLAPIVASALEPVTVTSTSAPPVAPQPVPVTHPVIASSTRLAAIASPVRVRPARDLPAAGWIAAALALGVLGAHASVMARRW